MANVTKEIVYSHDFKIGETIRVKHGELLLEGTLRFIQGEITDRNNTAWAWLELQGFQDDLSEDLLNRLPKKRELFTFFNREEDSIDSLYLYAVEFLDIEHHNG